MYVCRPVGMQTCGLSSKQAMGDGRWTEVKIYLCPRIPVVPLKTHVRSLVPLVSHDRN